MSLKENANTMELKFRRMENLSKKNMFASGSTPQLAHSSNFKLVLAEFLLACRDVQNKMFIVLQ